VATGREEAVTLSVDDDAASATRGEGVLMDASMPSGILRAIAISGMLFFPLE
jgi:hypothetical protein